MKRATFFLALLTILVIAGNARAGLALTLNPAAQNAAPGRTLDFAGTLTNTSPTDKLFLNDIALSGADPALDLEANTFFANVPGILLPGETYNGLLFRVRLADSATASDHSASIVIKGGSDIFAAGDLNTATFAVLSPSVTIAATTPSASESGPSNGLFTITRTGSTTTSLLVTFAISGTALNGTSYTLIPTSVTLPVGSASATVTVSPSPNNIAEGDRSIVLSLSPSSSYSVGSPTSATVILHDKPADNWRFVTFGSAANDPAAQDEADWDKDGVTNLMEFALGLNPLSAKTSSQPTASVIEDYLTLSFVPNPAATDVTFIIEASTALTTWNTSDVEDVTPAIPNPPGSKTFRYKNKVSDTSRAFLRLRVTRG
jgi:hypothetical protein